MAEVANARGSMGLSQQLWLMAGLRWRIFRNGLRSQAEKMHLIGMILLSIVFGGLILGLAIGIGIGSYEIMQYGQWIFLSLILWGIFLFWQVFPILASQTSAGLDTRNLLRFPLRFSAFMLMSVAYGLADPFAAAGILWHIAMLIGVSVARPELTWWAALALFISVLMNLLFNRMMYAWVERFLANRRVREVLAALFILSMISLQFTSVVIQKYRVPIMNFVHETAIVWKHLPPTETGAAIADAAQHAPTPALDAIGVVLACTVAFGALFAIRVHAQYTGEDLGESAAPSAPRKRAAIVARPAASAPAVSVAATAAAEGESRGLLSGQVAAVFWKEVRYLSRNSMLLMNMVIPFILIVLYSVSTSQPAHPGRHSIGLKFTRDFIYPGAMAYAFLIIIQMCPNSFAYEGRGIERLFLSPIKFRTVMLGKNLFQSALLIIEALLVLALVVAMGPAPRLPVLLATWAALPFAALVQFSVGDWQSLQYPRKFEFGVRRQRPSGMSVLITFAVYLAMMGVISGVAALCIFLHGLWLLPIVYLMLGALAFLGYRGILDDCSARAEAQRETLIEQLAK
jgi:ABC-2 type transport system permease protein